MIAGRFRPEAAAIAHRGRAFGLSVNYETELRAAAEAIYRRLGNAG